MPDVSRELVEAYNIAEKEWDKYGYHIFEEDGLWYLTMPDLLAPEDYDEGPHKSRWKAEQEAKKALKKHEITKYA